MEVADVAGTEVDAMVAAYPPLVQLLEEMRGAVAQHFGPSARLEVHAPFDQQDETPRLYATVRAHMARRELRSLLLQFGDRYAFELRPEACGMLTVKALPC